MGTKKKRDLTISEVASMGGRARAASMKPEERSQLALKAGLAAAAKRAACDPHVPVRRFSRSTGEALPGRYCKTCGRKLT